MQLSDLHAANPYDGFSTRKYPKLDIERDGWNSDAPIFRELIEDVRPGLIVEVGSWKGASAVHMADVCKSLGLQTTIVCVDTWIGSLEMWENQSDETRYGSLGLKHGYPQLYYQFLANVIRAGHSNRIVPFPQTSAIAARWLAKRGVVADLIYLDASHDYQDVLDDMRSYWPLVRPGGILFGDDRCSFLDVERALTTFCSENGLKAEGDDWHWVLRKA